MGSQGTSQKRFFDVDLLDFDRSFEWGGMTRKTRFIRTAYGEFLIWASDGLALAMNASSEQAQHHLKRIMSRNPMLQHNNKVLRENWQVKSYDHLSQF